MKLVDHYSVRLLYYIRRLLEDADRSDDVLQEVWLTVYKKLTQFATDRHFLSGSKRSGNPVI